MIFQRIILKTHNKKSIVYSPRAGNGDSNIDRDEVDKGNKTNNRISRIKSAVSKARERLKRDTSNSSCSSDSENILSSEEDADIPTSLNISNKGYVLVINISSRCSNNNDRLKTYSQRSISPMSYFTDHLVACRDKAMHSIDFLDGLQKG